MKMTTPSELVARFNDGGEFAVLDPREEGDFSRGHLMAASNLPFSRLELLIADAVPNLATLIILVDDDSGPAQLAAKLLSEMGYCDLSILNGGIAAWHGCGFPLFTGVSVPGKAFAEWVEHHLRPPAIDAASLKVHLDAGDPILLIDIRMPDEHTDYCIPGALLCPNGELPIQTLDLIAERNVPVVVHCAGRTRSIIGAQTLIDLGVTAPVYALENGTIGWEVIGAALEHGADRPLPETEAARMAGQAEARRLAREMDFNIIDLPTFNDMQTQVERTTVLVDVRPCKDYDAGHVPGAHNVPGGQLLVNVDKAVIVKNARWVLTDDDGTRATMTALWLKRMGFTEVYILPTQSGDRTELIKKIGASHSDSTPHTIINDVNNVDVILDCRSSLAYRRGHIPGSWFLSRANLKRDMAKLPATTGTISIIADDELYAQLLDRDLRQAGFESNIAMNGFYQWQNAGQEIETGYTRLASPPSDMFYDGEHMENITDVQRENRRYIDWEKALVHDLVDEPSVRYIS